MPFRINGIGTWHVGRKNPFTAAGRCSACGNIADHASYDTRNWITVVFVPIIPLGARRVINHCPSCDRFHVVPLKKWNASKAKAADELERVVAGATADLPAVIDAIESAASFQDRAMFDEMAPAIANRFASDGPVLRELASAYLYFGDLDSAQEYGERALDADPGSETQILLGRIMLAAGNLDDARACFAPILAEGLGQHAPILTTLVQSYQAEGKHDDALSLIEEIEVKTPEAASSQTIQKLKKLSAKHQTTGKRITPSRVRRGPSLLTRAAVTLFVVLLLIGLGFGAYQEWQDASLQDTYFVNGTERAYEITVRDQTLQIPAKSAARMDLPAGATQVKASMRRIANPEVEIEVPGTVWSRLGREDVFIVNLDQLAFLEWQNFGYGDDDLPDRDARLEAVYEFKAYTGELTYHIPAVHYLFTPSPDRLDISSSSKILQRTELMVNRDVSDADLIGYIWDEMGEDAGASYAERLFRTYPPTTDRLRVLFDYASEETFIDAAFERKGQGDVEYHRLLQEYASFYLDSAEIREHYLDLMERQPDNSDYMYLVGRTYDDGREGRQYYLRAIEGPNPSAYAYNALAYSARSAGRFQEGLDYARSAMEHAPDNAGFRAIALSLAFAAGDVDEVLRLSQATTGPVRPRDFINYDAMRFEVLALAAAGRHSEIQPRIAEMAKYVLTDLRTARREDADQAADYVTTYLNECVDYMVCDGVGIDELGERYENDYYRYEQQLINGDLSVLDEILSAPEEWSWDTHLMFAIGARLHGRSEAETCLSHAVGDLAEMGGEDAILASMLEGSTAPDAELAENLAMEPSAKALILSALTVFHDGDTTAFGNLARALNYERYIPYYLIDRAAGSIPSAVPAALTDSGE